MFASLIICTFQLEQYFSLTTNLSEQCFDLFFQRSERGLKQLYTVGTATTIPAIAAFLLPVVHPLQHENYMWIRTKILGSSKNTEFES